MRSISGEDCGIAGTSKMASICAPLMLAVAGAGALSACSDNDGGGDADGAAAQAYILYRTAANTPKARLHFASFAGSRDAARNQQDCETTAAVMNANMDGFGKETGQEAHYGSVNFWCEAGPYSIAGENPSQRGEEYMAKFPYNPVGEAGRLGK